MIIEIVLFVLVSIFLYRFFDKGPHRHPRFPPGPSGIPLLGYLPWLLPASHISIGKLGKKYGNIFSFKIGGEWYVVLNEYNILKKALKLDSFTGRPGHMIALRAVANGIAYTEGQTWMEQRRFTLKGLKALGIGKRSMEAMVHESVSHLIQYYKKTNGKPVRLRDMMPIAAINCIWYIVVGSKISLDDPKPRRILNLARKGVFGAAFDGPLYVMPWLGHLFPEWSGYNTIFASIKDLHSLFTEVIKQHQETFDPNSSPRDFVNMYIAQMKAMESNPDSSFNKENGFKNALDCLVNLILGSSDTITSTMEFVMLFLLKNPDKLKRLQEEIDNVLGKRIPTTADRLKMPYTEAVIFETFRLSSSAPAGILHTTTEDVEFEGYVLQKGTIIYSNLYGVHRDETYWANEFYPERFLKKDGNGKLTFVKDERVIAFSVGKRECPAVNIAHIEFFVLLTSFLQNFNIEPGSELPGYEAKTSFVLTPNEYEVIFESRD